MMRRLPLGMRRSAIEQRQNGLHAPAPRSAPFAMPTPRYDADALRAHPLGILAAGPCVHAERLPIPLTVHFATSMDLLRTDAPYNEGHILTRETPTGSTGVAFMPGDAIVSGTQGEVWPIARARFEDSYRPADENGEFGVDGHFFKVPVPVPVWARQMDRPFALTTSRGRLSGEIGDWLIEYSPGSFGIVSARIFAETYRVLSLDLPSPL